METKPNDLAAEPSFESKGMGSAKDASTFALVYESNDGRLCVFEDDQGHITSVPSHRMV